MRTILFLASFLFVSVSWAQAPSFTELSDSKPHTSDSEWEAKVKAPMAAWGSIDKRYQKNSIPQGLSSKWAVKAWKGERVNGQAVIYTPSALSKVTISASALKKGSYVISQSAIKLAFVRYVMCDEINKDKKGACRGNNIKSEWDSSIVADMLDASKSMPVEAKTTRPVWISVWVPQDAKAGTYKGTLNIAVENGRKFALPYQITVEERVLPMPDKWSFHLDLWQNPYAVARYYNVPLWSKEHFDYMRPIMEAYAKAGGKVITASIINRPWDGQTQDAFSSMVKKEKKLDGTWDYDYTVFDKWVEFMMSCGVTEQIDCYTVVPWNLKFDYYSQASNNVEYVHAQPGSKEYKEYWAPFLKDFASHLKSKGWLSRTAISMDERPEDAMKAATEIIHNASSEFKIAGAIKYYPNVEPNIYDLCLSYGSTLPDNVLKRRIAEGKKTTVYTCCAEAYPNTFTFSQPAEATWLPIHAAAIGIDGYLRWAYNSWTLDPLRDSRFRSWASGDCYLVYPNSSSIRFERLIEGIQYYEKIRVLRKELAGKPSKLKALNEAVAKFVPQNLHGLNATQMVNDFKTVMNKY